MEVKKDTTKFNQMILHRFILLCSLFSLVDILSALGTASTSKPIPITVLSGFLGSGKTTLLTHLLNNSQGLKIGVIVNDVAEVNIDNKLIVGTSASSSKGNIKPAGVVELSNGCACCSIADELLPAVSELVTLSDMRCQSSGEDDAFDHIVIELSGVASPKSIRSNFQEAELYGMPLLERVKLDTMVTMIDCGSFLDQIGNDLGRRVTEEESPELFFKSKDDQSLQTIENQLYDSLRLTSAYTPDTATVSQLLVEQTEISDVILLNKIDIQSSEQKMKTIRDIVKNLNPRAKILQTTFGIVDSLSDVLASAGGVVADSGSIDDFKDSVSMYESYDGKNQSHSHVHDHEHHVSISKYTFDGKVCIDPSCINQSHSHSHDHVSANENTLGIGTFIYRARRPFHPKRLESLLTLLPVKRGLSGLAASMEYPQRAKEVFGKILRCKGFSWLGNSHIACQFWSHAGSSFEMHTLGRWWATLPRNEWPEEAIEEILVDFDSNEHVESKDLVSVGDRRQEIVFIGYELNDVGDQIVIQQHLDKCLLNDDEYSTYKSICWNENALKENYPSSIERKLMTY